MKKFTPNNKVEQLHEMLQYTYSRDFASASEEDILDFIDSVYKNAPLENKDKSPNVLKSDSHPYFKVWDKTHQNAISLLKEKSLERRFKFLLSITVVSLVITVISSAANLYLLNKRIELFEVKESSK